MYSYAEKLTTPHWLWWLWRQLVGPLFNHLDPQTNPIPSQLLPLPVIQKCPTWYSQTKFLGIVPYFQYHILIRLTHLQIAPQTMAPSPLPLLAPSYLFNTILVCSWSFTHPVPHPNQSIRVTLDNYPSSLPSPKLQATMMTITTNFPITILLNQKSYLSVSSFTNHPNTTNINNQIYHCFHSTDPTLTLQTCITAQAQILRKILQYNHTTQHTSFIQYIAGPIADQPKKQMHHSLWHSPSTCTSSHSQFLWVSLQCALSISWVCTHKKCRYPSIATADPQFLTSWSNSMDSDTAQTPFSLPFTTASHIWMPHYYDLKNQLIGKNCQANQTNINYQQYNPAAAHGSQT